MYSKSNKANFNLNHKNTRSLTCSPIERIRSSLCWKIRLFISFQIMETTANHNILNTKHIFLEKTLKPQSWFRCAIRFRENAEETPNQPQITYQMLLKKPQETNNYSLSSLHLHPPVQSCSSMGNTCLLSKLSMIGSQFIIIIFFKIKSNILLIDTNNLIFVGR